jgi:thiamine-phosphate pyrophosphorylase
VFLYAITSRVLLAETEAKRAEKLVALAAGWSARGVDFVQIRESDLVAADLARLAASVVRAVRANGSNTKVLINANPEAATAIALESGADGIHLPGGLDAKRMTATVAEVRKAWRQTAAPTKRGPGIPPISISCHSVADVVAARAAGASLALFAPVFEKVLPGAVALAGQGLESLGQACRAARQPAAQPELPILALGGVTLENAAQCIAAGAAGIAAIRLFLSEVKER